MGPISPVRADPHWAGPCPVKLTNHSWWTDLGSRLRQTANVRFAFVISWKTKYIENSVK